MDDKLLDQLIQIIRAARLRDEKAAAEAKQRGQKVAVV